ncbi:hypothetical protein [Streptococcus ferus]|uniref:hypothetical protein n=1 Tax=Streptococcus ferus TaxID=1345 RepID=UPI0023531577|nr:hypothetical protein [Streptococcus ferus]
MIDNVKIKFFKRAISAVCLILVFWTGFGFGQMGKPSEVEKNPKNSQPKKSTTSSQLTEKRVKQFLVAYYTKKDLEENRNRYKEFMTEGMYNAVVAEENKAQNQAYKGYVINYEFQEAQIYIDQTNHRVICTVTYTNDLLQKKGDSEGAQKGVSNQTTLQLDYSKVDGKYLVNQMNLLLLTDSSNPDATQEAYGAVAPSASSDE